MSFTNSTDAYQKQVKSCLMIMQTNMQTIGLRKTRPSSLVKSASKIVVDKRLTMQSSKHCENIKILYPNDARFKFLDWKGSENTSRRLQSLRPIKSCVRTQLVLV